MNNIDRVLTFIRGRRRSEMGRRVIPKYRVGQYVRKKITDPSKTKFRKSGEPVWSRELYRITEIKNTIPLPSYRLSDASTDVSLVGTFSEVDIISASGSVAGGGGSLFPSSI